MQKIKLLLNNLALKLTGYTFSKLDTSAYSYRDDLYPLIMRKYGSLIKGKMLDIGADHISWPKQTFNHQVTTFDKTGDVDVHGDALNLPFADNSFDCVFCFETIEHVENPFVAITEIFRVLKPGGMLIATTPFIYELHGEEYGDYWRPTRQAWRLLLRKFKDVEVTHFGKNELLPHHYLAKGVK